MTVFAYTGAVVAEMPGASLHVDRSPLCLAPGMASSALSAYLLTLVDSDNAARAYAA